MRLVAEADDKYIIYKSLDEVGIKSLAGIDATLWKTFVLVYCEWVSSASFDFAFCDILVQRLSAVFDLGDMEIKSAAALAAARLGRSHNRWYVIGKILQLCGRDMDDAVAARICIDIRAFAAEEDFRACANVIQRTYTAYHARIRAAIETDNN